MEQKKMPKFNQICPNVIILLKKFLLEDAAASPAPTSPLLLIVRSSHK